MKQVLEIIIKNIVEDQDAVLINELAEDDKVIYKVNVAEKDMGRVIGKQGKIANSIRTFMKALGAKDKKKVTIEFKD